jgi:hemoglobin
MKDIETREDVELLIKEFYIKILQNKDLGRFFAEAVKNWDHHQARFVDYWESMIFFNGKYPDSPLKGHIEVDKRFDNGFEPAHFELWFRIFEENVDKHFKGEKAELAKDGAKRMAENIYKKMFIGRKPEPLVFG